MFITAFNFYHATFIDIEILKLNQPFLAGNFFLYAVYEVQLFAPPQGQACPAAGH